MRSIGTVVRSWPATGWLGIIIPTEFGGEGGSYTDAGVLFEELGRGPVPGPHLSSAALGALTILEAGTDRAEAVAAARPRFRPAYGRPGDHRGRLPVGRVGCAEQWRAADGDGYRISGTKVYVYDASRRPPT